MGNIRNDGCSALYTNKQIKTSWDSTQMHLYLRSEQHQTDHYKIFKVTVLVKEEKLNNERKNQYQTLMRRKTNLTYWNAIINFNILVQTLFNFKLQICLSTQGDFENMPVSVIHWTPDYSRPNRCGDAQGQSSNFAAKLWYVVVRKNAFFPASEFKHVGSCLTLKIQCVRLTKRHGNRWGVKKKCSKSSLPWDFRACWTGLKFSMFQCLVGALRSQTRLVTSQCISGWILLPKTELFQTDLCDINPSCRFRVSWRIERKVEAGSCFLKNKGSCPLQPREGRVSPLTSIMSLRLGNVYTGYNRKTMDIYKHVELLKGPNHQV